MENVFPKFAKSVFKEIRAILDDEIDGVSLELNEQDLTDLKASIIGPRDTPFENGLFIIRLILPTNYPTEPPKGFFLTKIFHPNVNPRTGEICIDTLKKEWNPVLGLRHILLSIRCLLIVPNPESALNEEAGRLLLEDYDEYTRQARIFTSVHALGPAATPKIPTSYPQDSTILRDSNGHPEKSTSLNKKKTLSVTKKTMKRL
uniref:E2 ubiquitin-conjugating enzyme n=1 Tax=Schistocephalus solidus TaxID=70667 RepID=A0A0X3NGN8_SCHSO